jgi:hypothetical protein
MNLIKSKRRVADHGEVFTPPWLVEKMLDLVKGETERIDSRFLEPACEIKRTIDSPFHYPVKLRKPEWLHAQQIVPVYISATHTHYPVKRLAG